MVFPRVLIASLLLSFLFLHAVQALESEINQNQVGSSTVPGTIPTSGSPVPVPVPGAKIDCTAACGVRCSATKRPNLCKRACGSCCNRCNCVPPGTSGNYEACACYANLTTKGNVRKCP